MTRPAGRQNEMRRIREIARLLAGEQPASRKVRRDPLDELLLTVLSQSTTDANCYRAWEALRARYPDWDAVLDAPDGEVEETIRPAGLSTQKSGTILSILRRLREETGRLSLGGLAEMSDDEALAYPYGLQGGGSEDRRLRRVLRART